MLPSAGTRRRGWSMMTLICRTCTVAVQCGTALSCNRNHPPAGTVDSRTCLQAGNPVDEFNDRSHLSGVRQFGTDRCTAGGPRTGAAFQEAHGPSIMGVSPQPYAQFLV